MSNHISTGPSPRFPDGNPFGVRGDLRSGVKLLAVIAAVLCWGCFYRRQVDAAVITGVLLTSGWNRRWDLRRVVETVAVVAVIVGLLSIYRR